MNLPFWFSHPAGTPFDPTLVQTHESTWCAGCSARVKLWVENQAQLPYAIANLESLVKQSEL